MPGRVEYDVHVSVCHGVERIKCRPSPCGDALAHWTTRRSESHGDAHRAAINGNAENEAEVHDVASDFRINHLTQGVKDNTFGEDGLGHKIKGEQASHVLRATKFARDVPRSRLRAPKAGGTPALLYPMATAVAKKG